ncbi:MAG: acetyl-CoA decarbonylase/synthase complex subunit gamma [Endomicrobiia bacterium]
MPITGLEIYKLLPKTNCKKCGFPTCLAFAMALAAKKVSLDNCPEVSEETKQVLLESSEPPIKTLFVGKYKIGGETVLFRHEKTFYNPTLLGVMVKDSFSDEEIIDKIKKFKNLKFDRVGQKYCSEIVFIHSENNDFSKIQSIFKILNEIISNDNDVAISFCVKDIKLLEQVLQNFTVAMIGIADITNISQYISIAQKYNLPLIVEGKDLDEIAQTIGSADKSFKNFIIKIPGENEVQVLENLTQCRRLALKKNFRLLGYPTILISQKDDITENLSLAVVGITKYASIVVVNTADPAVHLPLVTLRLNIYTDPQKPVTVEPKLYKIGGEPTSDSPLLVTTNFSLTYFSVEPEIINSKIPSWLLIVDADGLSVLTAWAAEKFTAEKIVAWIKKENVESKISHKTLIIPGYVAILSGKLNDLLPDWKIIVGPKESSGIPKFLKTMFG